MNRLKLLTTFILLLTATVFAEEDHDHDHEEHEESPAHECEEAGGLYCFNPATSLNCYKDGMTDLPNSLEWYEAYCLCTETSDVSKSLLTDKKVTAALGTDGKPNCTSTARDNCFIYKESMYNFYQGECWTMAKCNETNDNFPNKSWKAGDVATCAYVEDRCNRMDDAEWHEDEQECECKEEGAKFHIDHCHGEEHDDKTVGAEKWLFGILAVAFVSAFAVIGVLIVLLRHQWWYDLLLSFMVALAMGCLLSDATLHLIPLALGLHSHDDGEDGHDHGGHAHEDEEEEMTATQRRNITIGITAGVYLFLLFEKLIHVVIPNHSHSHGPTEVIANPNAPGDVEMKPKGNQDDDEESEKKGICNVDSVAWMIIFGDALHNFADGLVMGAAFSESNATGLGTTIAVFCHEVPHELGDFAVLLNAGMKIRYAVLFNFLSACTCFLGLFVGILAGENEDVQKWIFAFTAGMFIYIACADLIPEMNKMCEAAKRPKLNYFLQQVGVFCGFLVMYLIAVYEGELASIGGGGHHHH